MCGIAGLLSRSGGAVDRSLLARMVQAVAHRGPDGEGVFVEGSVGFGHRRLAIIDLSDAGAQPMRRPGSGCVIVYNGEVYNYLELRAELQTRGHRFESGTDTEVILAAYEEWGPGCVRRFNGMWAFALYDPRHDLVFCSRDRFGVKPFYYVDQPYFLAFGSEIRQLVPLLAKRIASREMLLDYLGFAAAPSAGTFFGGVNSLPPGHNLFYRVASGRFSIEPYYRVLERQAPRAMSRQDARAELCRLITDAVRLRLRSDVRVGTCLSGGLDSSTVASIASSLMREQTSRAFAAITAISEIPENDESEYARLVVEQARLEWHTTRPDYDAFAGALTDVVRAQEEPFASPSICMQFFVMREAKRRRIPVLLDGQGGDETLLGYERYVVPAIKERYATRGLRATLQTMRSLSRNNQKLPLGSQLLFLPYFSFPTLRWGIYRLRARSGGWLPSLAHFRRKYGRTPETMFELQRQQIERESIPHLVRYEDKNAMWHSVETRLPFLDYRLVEFALGLATDMKIRNGWTKCVLREAMEGVLPAPIAWRRDKVGFEAPDSLWMPKLRDAMIAAVSASDLVKDVCGAATSPGYWAHLPPQVLWRFYIAALWAREFDITGLAAAEECARAS